MNELREQLKTLLPSRRDGSVVVAVTGPEEASRDGAGSVAGVPVNAMESLLEELSALRRSVGELRDTGQKQNDQLDANTRATLENTTARAGGAAASVRSGASAFGSNLGSSSNFSPLISGLIRLFGRKDGTATEPLPAYSQPTSLRLEAALPSAPGGLAPIHYDSDGLPRRNSTTPATAGPQITVQVQAMDSQSFLDRSDDIARAVRQAMLNMHSLNDVVGEM